MRGKEAVPAKSKVSAPIVTGEVLQTDNVIDFMPYLSAKQRQSARDAMFLTLFLIFVSLFIVLV